jgi:hypothetical protein
MLAVQCDFFEFFLFVENRDEDVKSIFSKNLKKGSFGVI